MLHIRGKLPGPVKLLKREDKTKRRTNLLKTRSRLVPKVQKSTAVNTHNEERVTTEPECLLGSELTAIAALEAVEPARKVLLCKRNSQLLVSPRLTRQLALCADVEQRRTELPAQELRDLLQALDAVLPAPAQLRRHRKTGLPPERTTVTGCTSEQRKNTNTSFSPVTDVANRGCTIHARMARCAPPWDAPASHYLSYPCCQVQRIQSRQAADSMLPFLLCDDSFLLCSQS